MTITVAQILARARTLATQTDGVDATASQQIDARGGLRALIPHAILATYRAKAKDQRFVRDITVKHTVSISAGVGAIPDGVMRELMTQANVTDADNSLVSYDEFGVDFNSGQNFDQLGYLMIVGDDFHYTAPAPTTSYTGNLYVTAATVPTTTGSSVTFPSTETSDDVVYLISQAIQGKVDLFA